MTNEQKTTVAKILGYAEGAWFHHGDCDGADKEAHLIARHCNMKVCVHPPIKINLRAFCRGDIVRAAKEYIERDHDIVDEVAGLIAAPSGFNEEIRSGTWATIRYARKVDKPHLIVWPDGTYNEYR